jgi:hypothetical protein
VGARKSEVGHPASQNTPHNEHRVVWATRPDAIELTHRPMTKWPAKSPQNKKGRSFRPCLWSLITARRCGNRLVQFSPSVLSNFKNSSSSSLQNIPR